MFVLMPEFENEIVCFGVGRMEGKYAIWYQTA